MHRRLGALGAGSASAAASFLAGTPTWAGTRGCSARALQMARRVVVLHPMPMPQPLASVPLTGPPSSGRAPASPAGLRARHLAGIARAPCKPAQGSGGMGCPAAGPPACACPPPVQGRAPHPSAWVPAGNGSKLLSCGTHHLRMHQGLTASQARHNHGEPQLPRRRCRRSPLSSRSALAEHGHTGAKFQAQHPLRGRASCSSGSRQNNRQGRGQGSGGGDASGKGKTTGKRQSI